MNNPIDNASALLAASQRAAFARGAEADKSAGPDFRRVMALFMRHLRVFFAVVILVFVGAIVATMEATPLYTATANVMLDVRKQQVIDTQAVLSGLPADTAVVDSEVEVLKSRHLASRVVDSLHLDQDPEFNTSLRKPTPLSEMTKGVTGLFAGGKKLTPGVPSPLAEKRAHEAIIQNVLRRLDVKRAGLTYLINISFTSPVPAKASQIADAFAKYYLTEQMETKFDATQQANQWLDQRLGELRVQVQQADDAVSQYKIANNLMSASGATLTEQEISSYNQQVTAARAQEAEASARLETARKQLAAGSNGEDLGEALGSVVIQQLRAQRAQVSSNVAQLQEKYGPRHPEMLKAQRQLSDIDGQIQAETGRIISNLEGQAQIAHQRTSTIESSKNTARGALAVNNRAEVRLHELERNADAVRTLYESFLARFKQTSTEQGLEHSDARIVSTSNIPTVQTSPDIRRNLLLGLLLALAAGTAGVLVAERLDEGLTTAEDVERRLDMPYLGAIPHLGSVTTAKGIKPVDYVLEKPLSSFAEAFRALRASLLYAQIGESIRVLSITSALPAEGKTMTAVALGRSAAQAGNRVCIVDCDLRRRNVNHVLGLNPERGLLDLLAGQVSLNDVLMYDERSGASILPLAKRDFTPKDVFGSPAMDQLLAELRLHFDLIILDTAPVLAVADSRIISARADATLFLTRWRKTPQKAVEAALKALASSGARVVGIALTQVDAKAQARYGYGDPGYYYGEYRKYYEQ